MKKIIISGGGTGGHIYPALALADALKAKDKSYELLFVGAEGKMELEIVPKYGYKIIALPIRGFNRGQTLSNLTLPFRIISSILKAIIILQKEKPNAVIGTGGYASLPLLWIAQWLGIKTFIQEQNSYPGWTNRLLSSKADKIGVAYPNMDKYFPSHKLVFLGNPVRSHINLENSSKQEALDYFGIKENKKRCLLIMGGSLGAKSINTVFEKHIQKLLDQGISILWQTGKLYHKRILKNIPTHPDLKIKDYIDNMAYAYKVADLVISRAGALSISELALARKACILIPSPNVAEDHQTKNSMALKEKNAALMLPDHILDSKLIPSILDLFQKPDKLKELSVNIKFFAKPNAANDFANLIP